MKNIFHKTFSRSIICQAHFIIFFKNLKQGGRSIPWGSHCGTDMRNLTQRPGNFPRRGILRRFSHRRESPSPLDRFHKSLPQWLPHGVHLLSRFRFFLRNITKFGLQMIQRKKIATKYFSDTGIPQNRKITKIWNFPKSSEKYLKRILGQNGVFWVKNGGLVRVYFTSPQPD